MAEGDEEQYDRVAQLRESQQRNRMADERAAEEAALASAEGSGSGNASSVFGIGRDELNDNVSRFLAKPEPVELILGFIPYVNLQLIWGQIITNGKSKYVTPPNFRPWNLQWILPNILASVIVIVFDLLILILALPSFLISLLSLYFIGLLLTNPTEAVFQISNLFGAFGTTLVQWLGFPSV
jgi:hypothetical protein